MAQVIATAAWKGAIKLSQICHEIHKKIVQSNGTQRIQQTNPISLLKPLPDVSSVTGSQKQLLFYQEINSILFSYLKETTQITPAQLQRIESAENLKDKIILTFEIITGGDILKDDVEYLRHMYNNPPSRDQTLNLTVPKIIAFLRFCANGQVIGLGGNGNGLTHHLRKHCFPLGLDTTTCPPCPEMVDDKLYLFWLIHTSENYLLAFWLYDKMKQFDRDNLSFASAENGTALDGYHMYSNSNRVSNTMTTVGGSSTIIEGLRIRRLGGIVSAIIGGNYSKIVNDNVSYQHPITAEIIWYGFNWLVHSEVCHLMCYERTILHNGVPANRCESPRHMTLGDSYLNNNVST